MRVHHLKHHEAYRTNLNAALQALRELSAEGKALAKHGVDALLTQLDQIPNEELRQRIRNHGMHCTVHNISMIVVCTVHSISMV